MAKVLIVSFKDNEQYLYEKVKKHSGQSGFVKDALKFYLEYLEQNKRPSNQTAPQNELNQLMDI